MKNKILGLPLSVLAVLIMTPPLYCAEIPKTTPAELSQQSIKYCNNSSCKGRLLTPQIIMQKVRQAAKLINKEGEKAFPKFRGETSEFIFCGTYIWIHDTAGIVRMHPINYKLEGTRMLNFKDIDGKMFILDMTLIAREKGEGWIQYKWPLPGSDKPVTKVSFVKLAKHGDKEYVIGCGIYNTTLKKVLENLTKKLPLQPELSHETPQYTDKKEKK